MLDSFRREMIGCLPRLRRFALALTGDSEGADDLVQETCIRALSRVEQFRKGTRLDSWLFRIAQNEWIDRQRSLKARGQHIEIEDAPVISDAQSLSRMESGLALAEVSKSIAALPKELQMVLMLVCVDGRSYKEASDMLAIPTGTVMSRLARARQLLHTALYTGTGETPSANEGGKNAISQ